jgi:hypothetical protein
MLLLFVQSIIVLTTTHAIAVVALSNNNNNNNNPMPFWTRRDLGSSAIVGMITSSSSSSSSWATDIVPKRLLQRGGDESVTKDKEYDEEGMIELPLRFLPNGGCWAIRVTIDGGGGSSTQDDDYDDIPNFSYFAVLDTGSPFLTGPPVRKALDRTTPLLPTNANAKEQQQQVSSEQYGESVGEMTWRRAATVTLGPQIKYHHQEEEEANADDESTLIRRRNDVVLGIPTPTMIEETGGIYVGLMDRDDYRPSVLEQFGIGAFEIQFRTNVLKLYHDYHYDRQRQRQRQPPPLIASNDPAALELFDLSPYGPDLHHYGVRLCQQLELIWQSNDTNNTTDDQKKKDENNGRVESIPIDSLKRPVVAVLDTGLTGCIFSDSLYEELWRNNNNNNTIINNNTNNGGGIVGDEDDSNRQINDPRTSLRGLTVTLSTNNNQESSSSTTVRLSSNDKYWRFSSFRLPWFDDEARHPHIIALGCTFWANVESLGIDTITRRAKIR